MGIPEKVQVDVKEVSLKPDKRQAEHVESCLGLGVRGGAGGGLEGLFSFEQGSLPLCGILGHARQGRRIFGFESLW